MSSYDTTHDISLIISTITTVQRKKINHITNQTLKHLLRYHTFNNAKDKHISIFLNSNPYNLIQILSLARRRRTLLHKDKVTLQEPEPLRLASINRLNNRLHIMLLSQLQILAPVVIHNQALLDAEHGVALHEVAVAGVQGRDELSVFGVSDHEVLLHYPLVNVNDCGYEGEIGRWLTI